MQSIPLTPQGRLATILQGRPVFKFQRPPKCSA